MTNASRSIRSARQLAGELLSRTRAAGPFIADLFDGLADASGLDARDRHLAHELAAGVVRHRRTLDCVLNTFSRRPIVKSPPPLRILLRLGAYQLLFLDRIPDHAAVDETVELAKAWARPRMHKHPVSIAGFVNGVLRGLIAGRQMAEHARGQNPRRTIESPVSQSVTVLDRDVFADPDASPGDWLADAYSFEPWLAGRWVERLGMPKARELARAQNRRAGMVVRVNTLRTDLPNAQQMLEAEGLRIEPTRSTLPLLRVLEGDVLASRAMTLGLLQPQDPWAASVVAQLDLRPGLTVLDRCAAPGTKTTQMIELMRNQGLIIAVDPEQDRLDALLTNVRRLGGHIVRAVRAEAMPAELLAVAPVDRALVDVPCSNSGVLARRPEARWRINAEALGELAGQQRDLLMDAINWVAPGGKIVYSTCSIEPEENAQVVEYAVKRRHGQVRLVSEKLTLPSLAQDHDGGYWALLERVR